MVTRRKRLARRFVDGIIQGSIHGRQASLDGLKQIVVGVGAFVPKALREEGRRAVHATMDATLNIGVDALAVNMLLEARFGIAPCLSPPRAHDRPTPRVRTSADVQTANRACARSAHRPAPRPLPLTALPRGDVWRYEPKL